MNLEHLSALRQHELDTVLKQLHRHGMNSGRLLEIGAGTGQQALTLAAKGYHVSAIDLPQSRYAPDRVWPVINYDGQTLPFADNSFDIVYSSNVLEHIADTDRMQHEISRVLTPEGLAIHVLPSPAWRVLTMLMHYPWLATTLVRLVKRKLKPQGQNNISPESSLLPDMAGRSDLWRRIPYANRHGEHGNALTEAYHFRRTRWRNDFERNNFRVVEILPSGLIYSGYALLGGRLPIATRAQLASLCGSACNIFILQSTGVTSAG
ncbi:MAG: methyltransferase domain-containing protein [Rhodocyclaceae bacterium]